MQSWFGLNPLDVMGTVAFSTVALAVFYIGMGIKNHRAQKRSGQKDNRTIDLTR